MSKPPLRAVIWCAVSTKSQTEDAKVSLPQQEADARAVADREGWHIADILRVPGHSRRYVDIHECAAAMRSAGIDAFDRLLAHWAAADFDVLVVRDGDRFARTQSLHAYVTERTIDIGARLYSLSDGWVDEHNYRLWAAMGGYKAAASVDFLMHAFQSAQDAKLDRGVAMGSRAPFGFVDVRNDAGKRIGLAVDESLRRLWDDVAAVFLAGMPFHQLGQVLYDQYGHTSPRTGKAYHSQFFYAAFYRPAFWGNSARKFDVQGGQARGLWVFDPAVPAPEGVEIVYGTHDAIYTGQQARDIQAEMRRRAGVRGNMSPNDPYKFSGLLICGYCGAHLAGQSKTNPKALTWSYRCMSEHRVGYDIQCKATRKYIHEPDVIAWFDERLRALVDGVNRFVPDTDNTGSAASLADRIAALESEIAADEDTLKRMVLRAARETDPALVSAYGEAMHDAADALKRKQARLVTLRQQLPSATLQADTARAQGEIVRLSVDAFWQLEDREINQLLRRAMGDLLVVVVEGEITGVIDGRG